jgi:cytochrome c biogenesis protein CcdA/thiol-disulfide isomerase/thioredoxin
VTLFVLSYLAGALTILAPCILPVVPFVFAKVDRSFVRSSLPLLAGMVLSFVGVATLALVGGAWAARLNELGRGAALVVLALMGLALLLPTAAERWTRPLVALGSRVSEAARRKEAAGHSVLPSFALGAATGLLWAPCAGPVLGLVLTTAALQGASARTTLLLLAYAAGAATSLAMALWAGGRVLAAMKRSLGVGEWVRRGLGVAVLAGVTAVALGQDTGLLARLPAGGADSIEQELLERLQSSRPASRVAPISGLEAPAQEIAKMTPVASGPARNASPATALPVEGRLPDLSGATMWLNSQPLSPQTLRGKVVLIDFWTYSCINCLRTLPYLRAWEQKYKDAGLVVLGVHAPEFAFEKRSSNVRKATKDLRIEFPVAVDNDFAIWRAFGNRAWPAFYFIDAQGRIRHHQFGENQYEQAEQVIQQLLAEAGQTRVPAGLVAPRGQGIEAAPGSAPALSEETYLGYERTHNFASPGGIARDRASNYKSAASLRTNQWALAGDWTVEPERVVLHGANGRIVHRFHARDLHLVLGPSADGKPVRFKVRVDGKAPGSDHGSDIDAEGNGTIDAQRLYQLVRQASSVKERLFEIEFIDPGAQAYAFTFG